jgi:hypothetical protein
MLLLAAEIGADRLLQIVNMLEGGDVPGPGLITPLF